MIPLKKILDYKPSKYKSKKKNKAIEKTIDIMEGVHTFKNLNQKRGEG